MMSSSPRLEPAVEAHRSPPLRNCKGMRATKRVISSWAIISMVGDGGGQGV